MQIGSYNALHSLNTLDRAHKTNANTLQRISDGSKHSSAAFGSAAYAIVQRTYANIGAVSQSNQNAQNASAMLATASGGVSNTVESLTNLRETILHAANGTNGPSDLATLQKSIDQTIHSIDDTVDSATFNGKRLLDGDKNVMVAGSDSYKNVPLGNLSAEGLGLRDDQGRSTVNVSNPSSIADALDKVDHALGRALDQATTIGAAQQGLSYRSANYTTMEEGLQGQASVMDSTDIAKGSVDLRNAQTQEQLALFATKMNNHNRGAVLALLR